jgi:hypothetical protein
MENGKYTWSIKTGGVYEFVTPEGETVKVMKKDVPVWYISKTNREGMAPLYATSPKGSWGEDFSVYLVTVSKDGKYVEKTCYLDKYLDLSQIENDQELESMTQDFFSPQRLSIREKSAHNNGTEYLYMGSIDRNEDGHWTKYRVAEPEVTRAKYDQMRKDEMDNLNFVLQLGDEEIYSQVRGTYGAREVSSDETEHARLRLLEIRKFEIDQKVQEARSITGKLEAESAHLTAQIMQMERKAEEQDTKAYEDERDF